MIPPHTENGDNGAESRGKDGEYPGAHYHLGFGPANGFEMMVKRRREKHFSSKKFFAKELNNHTPRFKHIDKDDNKERKRGIGEHRNHAQRKPQ